MKIFDEAETNTFVPLGFLAVRVIIFELFINKHGLHHSGELIEDFMDRLSAFSTALHVGDFVLTGKIFGFLVTDLPLGGQITFGANKNDLSVLTHNLCQLINPISYVEPGRY